MAKLALRALAAVAVLALLGAGSYAIAGEGKRNVKEDLSPGQEVPSVSSGAVGDVRARIAADDSSFDYTLTYAGLTGSVTQAHIHFGQRTANGGVSVWLCSNLASPPTPAGVQACPSPAGSVSGTVTASSVVGPAGQGIAAGELGELIAAIRSGLAYVNVHSSVFPGGELRAQLNDDEGSDD